MVFAVANQVRPAHGFKCLAQQRPIVGVVVAQEGFVQAAALFTAHDIDRFTIPRDFAQRVFIGVVHRRGGGHGRWVKGLYLVSPKAAFLEPLSQMHHVFVAGTGMRGDEVRNQKLFFAGFQAVLFKQLLEDRKSTRLNSSHRNTSRMPSSA